MNRIKLKHSHDLTHHVRQGIAWLEMSIEGENTAALTYAAFEFRFAIELLAVHYWATLQQDFEECDLRDIRSFKNVERRIYELAGHQKKIDRHFEFARIVLGVMKIDMSFQTPKIVDLSKYWHECSELCHIAWPLSCNVPEKGVFNRFGEISRALESQVSSLGWPVFHEASMVALRDKFIEGKASPNDVIAHIQRTGIWARVEFPNGRSSQFVGTPVPPNDAP